MNLTTSEAHAVKPSLTRVSWGFLTVNIGFTIAICYAISVEPTRTLALFSIVLLTFLSLWRPELALAAFINGIALVTHSWASIGLQGLSQPVASSILLLGFAVYSVRHGFRLRWGLLPAVMLSFAVLMIIGLLYTPAPALGLERTAQYLMINLVVFGVVLFNHDSRVLWRLLWGIVGFGLAIAALSVIDIVFVSGVQESRYSIVGINPIWYARGLGLTIILLFALTDELKRPALHVVKWLLLLLLFYLTVAAASRGPLLATVITVSIYLYWIPGRRIRPVRILPVALFLLLIVFAYCAGPKPEITGRLTVLSESYRDVSTLYRIQAVFTAAELFLDKPLLGVGTGGFSAFSPLEYPHNIIMETASEYGLIGIGFMVTVIALVVSQCRKLGSKLASRPRELSIFRCFMLMIVFSSINAQVSGPITGNSWIWLGIGGIWALGTLVPDSSENHAITSETSG